MRIIRLIRASALACALAAASAATAQPAGACNAAPNHSRQNCTILNANCGAGQLPNPGVYPACNCVCQATPAAQKKGGQSKAPAAAPRTAEKKPG